MKGRLVVTNGGAAAARLREAGFDDEVVTWEDVLHEGPVPGRLDAAGLREVRAEFIGERGWGERDHVLREFAARDARIAELSGVHEVALCFEHDLYDQLQLVQVLAALQRRPTSVSVTLASEPEYLGAMEPERMRAFFEARRSVTREQEVLAVRAWEAFTSPDSGALPGLLGGDTAALPFLAPALGRLLDEYPSERDGLSRSERQALEVISEGAVTVGEAYRRSHHEREDAVFVGDVVFAWYLERMSCVRVPLVSLASGEPVSAPRGGEALRDFWQEPVVITDAGGEVLEGKVSHAALNGVDRWYGGVHIVVGAA